jgi:SNF2 family DNA or RNA helicase
MFGRLDTLSSMERRGMILAALTKLKQLCNHPALLLNEPVSLQTAERSNKVLRLLEMIGELRAEGDRCLIFTQFVETGHLLQRLISQRQGEDVLFLHGGTPRGARDEMIARFQDESSRATGLPGGGGATGEAGTDSVTDGAVSAPDAAGKAGASGDAQEERLADGAQGAQAGGNSGVAKGVQGAGECGIFILSLKAGGIGLNLTAANHVFHFDRWWNPAVENQATDRAYRIGQTRHVQVHKFVALGTLEEKIDEMIAGKTALSDSVVGGGEQWITELSTEELRDLFALRNEWIDA